jgi:hypothetical protein
MGLFVEPPYGIVNLLEFLAPTEIDPLARLLIGSFRLALDLRRGRG